jgi:UDP-N-acetyl-D-galactosamine dehydrogenase
VQYGLEVDVYDPHANSDEVKEEFGIELCKNLLGSYDAIILAVAHNEFKEVDLQTLKSKAESIVFDTKSFFDRNLVDARL